MKYTLEALTNEELQILINTYTLEELCLIISGITRSSFRHIMNKRKLSSRKGFYSIKGKISGRPKGKPLTEKELSARKACAEKMVGDNNPAKRKESRDKIKIKKLEWWASKSAEERTEHNSKNNDSRRNKCKKNKQQWWEDKDLEYRIAFGERVAKSQPIGIKPSGGRNHKSGIHSSPKAGTFYYRSSWELSVAIFLDNSNEVISYQYEGYRITYDDSGRTRNFMNDFTVKLSNNKIVILEVKPSGLIKHCIRRLYAQFHYAINNNYEFRIITENAIKDITILTTVLTDITNGKKITEFNRCRS